MEKSIYEQIKEEIQSEYDRKMSALGELAPNMAGFGLKPSFGKKKPVVVAPKKADMVVVNQIPTTPIVANGKYVGKLLQCEILNCVRKTQPDHKCPSCTRRACTRHLRGKVCMECNERGDI